MTNIFIAPKIKVGFQKRDDTFTGQLAYIIYYDEKGKIRKEKSWEGWRDKTIDPKEFDNTPMDGFTLNKDVKRYSGEWFSSHRTMIRVHDPRGFEFEVTTENLIGILMHTDCLRRGLIGQFVYAWVGPELVLLPTNSEEYQNATKYTTGLAKKVKAKDLVAGVSYKTKREGDVVYLGKFNWYEYPGKNRYYRNAGLRKEERVHVFTKDDGKTFFNKSSVEFLSEANSDQPVSNFAKLVEKFNQQSYANRIVRYEFRPTTFIGNTKTESWYSPQLCRKSYFMESNTPGVYWETNINVNSSRKMKPEGGYSDEYNIEGYELSHSYYSQDVTGIRQSDGELVMCSNPTFNYRTNGHFYQDTQKTKHDLTYMQSLKFYDLYVVFENGTEKLVSSIYELTGEIY